MNMAGSSKKKKRDNSPEGSMEIHAKKKQPVIDLVTDSSDEGPTSFSTGDFYINKDQFPSSSESLSDVRVPLFS